MIIVSIPIEKELISLNSVLVKSIAITTRNIKEDRTSNFLASGFVILSQKKYAKKKNSTSVKTLYKYIFQAPGKNSRILVIINERKQLITII